MHVAAVMEINGSLLPALVELRDAMEAKRQEFDKIIKIGRTHLQVRKLILYPLLTGSEFVFFVLQGRYSSDTGSGI